MRFRSTLERRNTVTITSNSAPCTKRRITLRTPGYVDGVSVELPVVVVTGASPGKKLVVVATQHGREVNGPAAVYRALQNLNPEEMTGEIIFFPVANPPCIRMQVQDFPMDRNRALKTGPEHNPMNLNRQWPGDPDGSLPQRIAHAIWNAGLQDADCVLDLHCWGATTTALAWGQQEAEPFVTAFGFPWFQVHDRKAAQPGMLESACAEQGIPCVVCEMTPQNVVAPEMVEHGRRGILNLASHLGILPGSPEHPHPRYQIDQGTAISAVAERPGLIVSRYRAGDVVEAGETAAELVDLETLECLQAVVAPERRILFSVGRSWGTGQLDYSVVRAGETIAVLCGVAREFVPEIASDGSVGSD
ncbi:MAG: hypothetical protein GW893_11050 [Armatimonadetes bacterium]|nr:hypothetical protein [Armatimonadota bacterium]